jgi:hypothetical protein
MKRLTVSFILFTFFVLLIIGAQSLFSQPVNLTPTNGASVIMVGGSVSLSWTVGGGSPYTLRYSIDGGLPTSIFGISGSPYALGGLAVGNVVAWDITDVLAATSATTTFTVISAPTPTPANGATGIAIGIGTLTWTAFDEGGFGNGPYDVEVGTTLGGSDVATAYDTASTSIAIPPLSNGTTYYWQVRDTDIDGGGGNGTFFTFSFKTILAAPSLSNPVQGLTGVSVLPTLSWSDITGETGYTLKISTAGAGAGQAAFDAGLIVSKSLAANSTSYGFLATDDNDLPLTNGTVYSWQLFANDVVTGGYSGVNSLIRYFTVTPAFTVSQHTPSAGQYIQSTSVDLGWSLGHSASGLTFRIEYKIMSGAPATESDWSGASFTTLAGSSNSSYSKTISGLTLGKTYRWRVLIYRTVGGDYVHYPVTAHNYFYTEGGTTVTLTPNWPIGGQVVYTNSPRLDWIVTGFTSGLTYELDYDKGVLDGIADVTGITNLYYQLLNLEPGATYNWAVRANYSGSYTSWTASTSFVVNGPGTLEVPTPNYPRDSAIVYSNTPRLDWTLTTSGTGLQYQIRYSTSASVDGSGMLNGVDAVSYPLDAAFATFPSVQYIISPTLTPGTTYYWQVRSYSSTVDGFYPGSPSSQAFSAWSAVEDFVNNGPGTLVVPTPNWPTGGITVYTTNPTLTWYLNPYSTGLTYDIDYSDGGNPDGVADVTNISNSYYQLTGLTPGNTIKWRVRSKNTVPATSAWSSTESFVIAGGTTASYAVANWPIGGTTVYTNPPTLTWYLEGSTLGITGYNVKYKKTSAPANWITFAPGGPNANEGAYTGLSASTFSKLITVDLTYGATYYWAVYATGTSHPVNPLGVGYFTVVGGAGSTTIVNSYPYNGSTVNSTTVPFSWYVSGSSAGIVSYTLMYSQSSEFAGGSPWTETVTNITSIPKTISGLTNGATYYWKVKGVYADASETAFSTTWSFTIQQGSPIIVTPWIGGPHNVTVGTTSPTFSWILPVPPAPGLKYELEYANNQSFNNSTKVENIPNQHAAVAGLSSNTKYYWRVRSKALDGTYSYYSNLGKFDVGLPTGVDEEANIPTEFSLKQNYPNPFNPSTKISFDLPEAAQVTIKVYNTIGQLVATLASNELLNAGKYERTFDASGLPSGIYIYQLNSHKFNAYKKMLMVK